MTISSAGADLHFQTSAQEIAQLLEKNGLLLRVVTAKSAVPQLVDKVCIDSRAVGTGAIFFALRGQKVDGHDYLTDCARKGAAALVVSESFMSKHSAAVERLLAEYSLVLIVVQSPLEALQLWARAYLLTRTEVFKIGVTGSNGKTTSKELLFSVLSTKKKAFASPGNLNSVIGLPLAVLGMPLDVEVAIFEMAMSEKGEMSILSDIVKPNLALITNIGTAHIGNIGDQAGIAEQKKMIFSNFDGHEMAFVPEADQWVDFLKSDVRGEVVLYGETSTPGYVSWEPWSDGQIVHWFDQKLTLKLAGAHNRANLLAVLYIAQKLGYQRRDIARGVESFVPSPGRSELRRGRFTVMHDSYNANPDSMRASISSFMEIAVPGHRHVLILGDMKELGDLSVQLHEEIGLFAYQSGASVCIFFGEAMQAAWQAAIGVQKKHEASWGFSADSNERVFVHAIDFETVKKEVVDRVRAGDLILLKASRGMELERLLPWLEQSDELGGIGHV